ncbi:MAG: hypothetical protein HKO07_00745, partial [Pseudomonadales bacterium]|nr:hypothetical protein [Pseudomonadales bacterium]
MNALACSASGLIALRTFSNEVTMAMQGNRVRQVRVGGSCWLALLGLLFVTCLTYPMQSSADAREQARRIHDRLAGVPPSDTVLQQMEDAINGVGGQTMLDAADIAMNNPAFYAVTLKNIAAPWTNRDQNVFVPLNDYIATYIGLVRDQADFRRILHDDVIYVGSNVPGYANNNNDHYTTLENNNVN